MTAAHEHSAGFAVRLWALLKKEFRQMMRDKSNLMIGFCLPIALILMYGYGISFDLENANVAVVTESSSQASEEIIRKIDSTKYLNAVRVTSFKEAEERMHRSEVSAIVRIPSDFADNVAKGSAVLQLVLNGSDAQTANTLLTYVTSAVSGWSQAELDRMGSKSRASQIEVVSRLWFNEASTSTWFLIPGVIAMVLTLIGAFLASLLVAREWERGTFESLFVTPVQPLEIVIAKVAPYLAVGFIDILICLAAARWIFVVPIRGGLMPVILISVLYLIVSLLMGLTISAVTRSQFLASQVALVVSFMPAMMLSGFMFDLLNMPIWLQPICNILPATHYMKVLKVLFLLGNEWKEVLQSAVILTGYAALFTFICWRTLQKRLR